MKEQDEKRERTDSEGNGEGPLAERRGSGYGHLAGLEAGTAQLWRPVPRRGAPTKQQG